MNRPDRSPFRPLRRALLAAAVPALALAAAGCASAPGAAGPHGEPPPGAPTTGTITLADGVPMAYESRGTGDTAVVFVHCWACNRAFWREQVDAVANAGYRVVRFDLAGHGESGSGRDEWSVARLGADVAAALDAMDLDRVILVGHSMGGPISVEAAALAPERVAGIVCVDTLHDAEFEWPEGMAEAISGQLEADYRGGSSRSCRGCSPPTPTRPSSTGSSTRRSRPRTTARRSR